MFGIIISAFNSAFAYLLRTVIIKFVVFSAIFLVVKELFSALTSILPTSIDIQQLFDALPDSAWYFLNLFQITVGVTSVISAYFTRFIIRRIPFIG